MRAIIVDDEPLARDNLRAALARHEDVEVVAECADGTAAVEAIRDVDADVIFLDIEMPDKSGTEVVDEVGLHALPPVVFVTAYDHHAVKAFELHAVDYLLKPFEDERLDEALRRVQARSESDVREALVATLRALESREAAPAAGSAAPPDGYATRFMIRDENRAARFIEVDEVDWFEADGNYVKLHVSGRTESMRATLSGILEQLDPRRFVRIHRSTIVNVDRIREVQPWFGGDYMAVLDDGDKLKVSRVYRDDLLKPIS